MRACRFPATSRTVVPIERTRAVGYGARPEHYAVVGEVLIGAMAQVAGPAWEPRFEDAWSAAFGVVAGAMLEGAAEAELALIA